MEQYPGELPDHQARDQYFVRGDFVAVDKKGKQLPPGIRQRANGRYEGRVKVEYRSYTPKTRTSTRDIPLTEDILTLLENQKGYWGFKVERLDRYLFCNEEGKPLSRERVQAEIDRTIKRIRAAGHDFPRITSHGRVIIRTS